MNKKKIREQFREEVFERDKCTCCVCKLTDKPENLDAHHITDRTKMPNGGYVKENGITVHKDTCHIKVELFHMSKGKTWHNGLHPDDLYKMIGSSIVIATEKSNFLNI